MITRPNGKPYRPRKPPAGTYLDDLVGSGAVLILRTHDVDAHLAWARELWRRETGEDVQLVGVARWVRLVPWDASGHGGDSTWIGCHGDDPRGCPAVQYHPAPRNGGTTHCNKIAQVPATERGR